MALVLYLWMFLIKIFTVQTDLLWSQWYRKCLYCFDSGIGGSRLFRSSGLRELIFQKGEIFVKTFVSTSDMWRYSAFHVWLLLDWGFFCICNADIHSSRYKEFLYYFGPGDGGGKLFWNVVNLTNSRHVISQKIWLLCRKLIFVCKELPFLNFWYVCAIQAGF